jgi:membrane-associated protease RseP (regulator of RpoE activity)
MDAQVVGLIAFIVLLSLLLHFRRDKVKMQPILFPLLYMLFYRSQIGISAMDWLAKKMRWLIKAFGYVGIIVGFLGMGFIGYELIANIIHILTAPAAAPGVALVLPVKLKGTMYVPFFYWLISIVILATGHEFAHGVVSRAHNIKVKSSGFAFLAILVPILPAAFVEPDEKVLVKRPKKQQLSVFAAGPFANIIMAAIVLAIFVWGLTPAITSMAVPDGVYIEALTNETYPAARSGMQVGDVILSVNGQDTFTHQQFVDIMSSSKPGDVLDIKTNRSSYNVTLIANPENSSLSLLGIMAGQEVNIREGTVGRWFGGKGYSIALWIYGLFYWLLVLNLGVGFFNLAPIGPMDGGRMLQLATHQLFGVEKGNKVWKGVTYFFLALVIINILFAFFK